jgi:cellulose synthase (UDP-forming)
MPEPRGVDDAPLWLPTDRLSPLWNYGTADTLAGDGSAPLPVYLRVPPDLYYGETANLQLHLNYRYNAAPLADGSVLRVIVNGAPVNEAALLRGPGLSEQSRWILLPTADMRPSSNTFLFDFAFRTPPRYVQDNPASLKLQGEILKSSSLDIRGLVHWAAMPNLELFANAGFPFTRKADLSETTVVLPEAPDSDQLSLFLLLMSHFGAQTGYPSLRVGVSGPDGLGAKDRDYLILGTVGKNSAVDTLSPLLPVTFDGGGLHVRETEGVLASLRNAWKKLRDWLQPAIAQPAVPGDAAAMIEGIESPYSPDRSVVAVVLKDDSVSGQFADAFLARSQSSDISGSVALLGETRFASHRVGNDSYYVGTASRYVAMRIWLAENYWVLLASVTAICFLVAVWTRTWLRRHAEWRLQLAAR